MAKINADALITALCNEKVLEVLKGIIQDSISAALESKFAEKFDSLNQTIEALQGELKLRNGQISTLSKQNAELNTKVHNQSVLIEGLEAYNRQDNLIIQGLPLTFAQAVAGSDAAPSVLSENLEGAKEHSADTEHRFLQFCNSQLGVSIAATDVSVCHRLPKHARQEYPPVVVRFTNRKARELVLNARKRLRNAECKIFINEHLTRSAAMLFSDARKLVKGKKILQAWTKNGRVLVKALDNTVSRINTEADLASYY